MSDDLIIKGLILAMFSGLIILYAFLILHFFLELFKERRRRETSK